MQRPDEEGKLLQQRYNEYTRLAKINQRLMRYTFRLRGLDEYLVEVRRNLLRAKAIHAENVTALEAQHRKNFDEAMQVKHALVSELAGAREELNRLRAVTEMLESQLKDVDKQLAGSKNKHTDLSAKVQQSAVRLAEANRDLEINSHALDIAMSDNDSLHLQINDEISRAKQFNKEADEAADSSLAAKLDLDKLSEESAAKIAEMQEELNAKLRRSSEMEDKLRKKFGKILQQKLQQVQLEATADKDRGLSEIKAEYDQKWREYNHRINDSTNQNDALLQKVVKAELDLGAIQNRQNNHISNAAAEVKRAESLEHALESLDHSIQAATLSDSRKIEALEDYLEAKEVKYKALMEIKNNLAMEIKAYRLLLENEEDRLGGPDGGSYISPSKKHKSNETEELIATVKATKKVRRRVSGRTPAPRRVSTRSKGN